MFAKFTADAITQTLPSGRHFAAASNVPPTFFTEYMTSSVSNLQNIQSVPGAQMQTIPKIRIMHTLGSSAYRVNFMLLQGNLNNMKEGVSLGPFLCPIILSYLL